MAGGPLLPAAIRELASLPPEAFERVVAEPVVLRFRHALEREKERPLSPEEQEFIMVVYKGFDEIRAEGRAEGRVEGRVEGRADTLRRQVSLKFGSLPPDVEQRIAGATPEEIDQFLERILFVDSIEKLFA
jgi:hypothetical protein